jgi:hypothetical protein
MGALEKGGTSIVRACPALAAATNDMAVPFGETPGARDPRALAILAKTIYRELREGGFETRDVIALAGELLGQVTHEVRSAGTTGTTGTTGVTAEARRV